MQIRIKIAFVFAENSSDIWTLPDIFPTKHTEAKVSILYNSHAIGDTKKSSAI